MNELKLNRFFHTSILELFFFQLLMYHWQIKKIEQLLTGGDGTLKMKIQYLFISNIS